MTIRHSNGDVWENMEPHRLFLYSYPTRYISLLDKDGTEKGILRDIADLDPVSSEAVSKCLEGYYFIPKVLEFKSVEEKHGNVHFEVVTDHGPCAIEISFTVFQFRLLTENRLIIRDNNSNRFEVPDISKLSRSSLKILKKYL